MYDPWVTREVTLRDLFSHRSGLPGHAGDRLEDMGFDREAVLYRLRYQKPKGEFRATYAYTNFGLTEAAVAAARAAGKSWEDLSADRLYRPLGMKSTSSRYADYVKAPNRAVLHVKAGDKFVARHQRDPDAQSPAGGVSSSARDMVQWVRLQLGKGKFNGQQVISAQALGETHLPHMVPNHPADPSVDRAGFYGLGWNVSYDEYGRVQLGHSGGFALGAATNVALIPSEGFGIVALSNGEPIGFPEAINRSFIDLLSLGRTERDWVDFLGKIFAELFKPDYGTSVDYSKVVANKTPHLPLTAYVGTYHSDLFGDIEVAINAGSLELRQGPKKTPFRMNHFDRDIFTYQPVGENAYGPSSVAFTIGIDKRAGSLVIENLNLDGDGLFVLIPRK
jgi:CubicO group peptidase (beta-lactamase class C family)